MRLPAGDYRNLQALLYKAYSYEIHEQSVLDFHLSSARTKIVSSPARTAKSYSGWKDALPDVFEPGIQLAQGASDVDSLLLWIAAPNFDLAKEFDYAWEDLVERRQAVGMDYKVEARSSWRERGRIWSDERVKKAYLGET